MHDLLYTVLLLVVVIFGTPKYTPAYDRPTASTPPATESRQYEFVGPPAPDSTPAEPTTEKS